MVEKKVYEKPKDALYNAVCVAWYDLGRQKKKIKYFDKSAGQKIEKEIIVKEVVLYFELSEKNSKGFPFKCFQRWEDAWSEKSRWRKLLTAWRGEEFTEDEANNFDMNCLLGRPGMLLLKTNPSGTWQNIESVMPLPAGMQPVVATAPEYYKKVPNWIVKARMEAIDVHEASGIPPYIG